MDKKQQNSDKLLSDVYKEFANDPKGQDMAFLNTVFDFLNRRSPYLARPGVSNQVIQMVHNHIDMAKKQELENQSLNEKRTSGITEKTTKSISEKEAKELEQEQPESVKSEAKAMDIDDSVDKDKDKDNDNNDESESDTEAPPGNGGATDKYIWTQSLSELEINIDIDANLRGKHLNISIQKKRLFVAIKGQESTPIIDGELHEKINVDESTWTLDKEHGKTTKTLTISLTKIKGMTWWNRVIVGDPTIDTTKIQPENSKLDTLDPETRQTVEKMMFDQRQKMKGLPTSKELEQQKILEKFKAQHPEMDFSNLKMAPDSVNAYAQQ